MTSVRDIYDYLDSIAPFDTQLPFDNSGLQTGDFALAVENAMLCLDVTPAVVEQAARAGCSLVISHHPVLFHARKQLLCNDPTWLLARRGMACIASHTPLDICPGGVNDLLGERLALGEVTRLNDLLRLITLPVPLAAKTLAGRASRKLDASVRYCDPGHSIKTVALCGGQGCHFLEDVIGYADAFLTGDADHHNFLDAAQNGLTLIAAGHYETEIHIAPALAERLHAVFPSVRWHIANEYGGIKYA